MMKITLLLRIETIKQNKHMHGYIVKKLCKMYTYKYLSIRKVIILPMHVTLYLYNVLIRLKMGLRRIYICSSICRHIRGHKYLMSKVK